MADANPAKPEPIIKAFLLLFMGAKVTFTWVFCFVFFHFYA
jgi:hypothetical protein